MIKNLLSDRVLSNSHVLLLLLLLSVTVSVFPDWANAVGPVSAAATTEPSVLTLTLRRRVEAAGERPQYEVVTEPQQWKPSETAIIVCDMWDVHHSFNATNRVAELAPRMNKVLEKARAMGVLIVHAPSSCVARSYAKHPARKRVAEVPKAKNAPVDIGQWCHWLPGGEQAAYPIDQSDGGIDDLPAAGRKWHAELRAKGRDPDSPWHRQIEALRIDPEKDYITDDGVENWSIQEKHGIKNVILMGVHTNMCVLGRPFGLRQMAKNGRNVVLMRDMTDTMYNPRQRPFVSHFTGTDLIVEHIEKFVCPTVTSGQLLGDGREFRFEGDDRKHLLILADEGEYHTLQTLPRFAMDFLGHEFRVSIAAPAANSRDGLWGLEALETADVLLVAVRRRTLPSKQLARLKAFVAAGKPLVGVRTASHAFSLRPKDAPSPGHGQWPEFDRDVLGGHYTGHHSNKGDKPPYTFVWGVKKAEEHPMMKGVRTDEFGVRSWLYKVQPLGEDTAVLMMGRVGDRLPHEPVAWTNRNKYGGRVFYTSLGHPDDFEMPEFQRLLTNGVYWATGVPIPEEMQTGKQCAERGGEDL